MKVMLISAGSPADRYLIRRVLRDWPDAAILRPVWRRQGTGGTGLPMGLRALPGHMRQRYHRVQQDRRDRQVTRMLFGSARPPPLPPHERIAGSGVNGPHGCELITRYEPEVLVLSGAPILRQAVLQIPRVATVNVHFGIAPPFRGEHTLFHALYQRDYDHLGLTIHHVDAGIDTGPVIAHVHPALGPDDTEATLAAKCARLGAEVLAQALQALGAGASPGRPQQDAGRAYRYADRRVWQDAHYQFDRRLLGRRPPLRPARVVWYGGYPGR